MYCYQEKLFEIIILFRAMLLNFSDQLHYSDMVSNKTISK